MLEQAPEQTSEQGGRHMVMKVEGMMCSHRQAAVTKALNKKSRRDSHGQSGRQGSPNSWRRMALSRERMKEAVEDAGYEVVS